MYRRFQTAKPDDNLPAPEATDEVTHGSYGALLFDKRWRAKREAILLKDQYSCVVCKTASALQVHHRQYHYLNAAGKFKLPWDYPDHLLITLCEGCHQKGHKKYKVPIIYL